MASTNLLEAQREDRKLSKHACALCARRKVGCDKKLPICGTCVKNKAECVYEDPQPPQRRKRPADGDLHERINQLEKLLQLHGINPDTEDRNIAGTPWRTAAQQPQSVGIAKAPSPIGAKLPKVYLEDPAVLKLMDKSARDTPRMSIASFFTPPSSQNLLELHPEPRHIFRLWQVFCERSNPVVKIIHVPTMQQRILDTSWNLESCTKSLHALLFSIYLLAVVSLSKSECLKFFNEERAVLLRRYQAGVRQALMAADLFHTRELDVLQAFMLFLMSDPKSDTSTTLSAVAVRLALKMGLDREFPLEKVSFFDQEMRIRLWWQICTQDVLARHSFVGRDGMNTDGLTTSSARLPLNVNDTELHPEMTKPPTEYSRATEMIYVLVRYEGATFGHKMRSSGRLPTADGSPFDQLEKMMNDKYLRHCDACIPLHYAAQSMVNFALSSVRYRLACHKAKPDQDEATTNKLMDHAITVLEVERASREVPFASQLLWSISPVDLDALIHILGSLKQKVRSDLTIRGWDVVVKFWDDHVDDNWDDEANSQTSFFTGLADLTLDAWQERVKELVAMQGPEYTTPECIQKLQRLRKRDGVLDANVFDAGLPSQSGFDGMDLAGIPDDLFNFGNDLLYDFGFWNEIPQV